MARRADAEMAMRRVIKDADAGGMDTAGLYIDDVIQRLEMRNAKNMKEEKGPL
jgi:hypothetical protein